MYILASKLATMVEGESNEGEAITIQNLIDGKEYEVPVKKIIQSVHTSPQTTTFQGRMLCRSWGRADLG